MCGDWGAYLVGVGMEGCVVLDVSRRGECSVMAETKILVEIMFISGLRWVVLGESHGFPWDGDQAVSVRIIPGKEVF